MATGFRTLDIAIEFAQACGVARLPRHLQEQLNRCASSVALNLAEGSAKSSRADRYRSYRIALGSFREAETILRIADIKSAQLKVLTRKLAGHITNLCNSLK